MDESRRDAMPVGSSSKSPEESSLLPLTRKSPLSNIRLRVARMITINSVEASNVFLESSKPASSGEAAKKKDLPDTKQVKEVAATPLLAQTNTLDLNTYLSKNDDTVKLRKNSKSFSYNDLTAWVEKSQVTVGSDAALLEACSNKSTNTSIEGNSSSFLQSDSSKMVNHSSSSSKSVKSKTSLGSINSFRSSLTRIYSIDKKKLMFKSRLNDSATLSSEKFNSNDNLQSARGVLIVDPNSSKILSANRFCNHLLGYTDGEIIGSTFLSLISDVKLQEYLRKELENYRNRKELDFSKVEVIDGMLINFTTKSGDERCLSTWIKIIVRGIEKTTNHSTIVVVLEGVDEIDATLSVNLKTFQVSRILGPMQKLINSGSSQSLSSVFPNYKTILESIETVNCSGPDGNELLFSALNAQPVIPVNLRLVSIKSEDNEAVIKISCLPSMGGLVVISNQGTIESANDTFLQHMFGWTISELHGQKITKLIVDFKTATGSIEKLRTKICQENNIANNTPMKKSESLLMSRSNSFKKDTVESSATAGRSKNVPVSMEMTALHNCGKEFKVQVQIAVYSESSISLWISLSSTVIKSITELKEKAIEKEESLKSGRLGRSASIESHRNPSNLKHTIRQVKVNEKTIQMNEIEDISQVYEVYEVEREIGKGSHGIVQQALDKKNGREVSIKTISKSGLPKEFLDDRYGNIPKEVLTLQLCTHENIIKFLQAYDCPMHIAIVTEYVGAVDLFQFIDENPRMPEALAAKLFRQIANAISHCHANNIAHRDIKEENFLIGLNSQVKLIDFGSATLLTGPLGINEEFNTFFGTFKYVSPEVLSGRPYKGFQNDIWGLGITLFSMIYAEDAFLDVEEILSGIINPPFQASQEVENLMQRMLQMDPNERITIHEVIQHPWLKK